MAQCDFKPPYNIFSCHLVYYLVRYNVQIMRMFDLPKTCYFSVNYVHFTNNVFLVPNAVFKPIFASAKICINPNAEVELKSPKVKLYLEVQNIAIEMTKPQVGSDGAHWAALCLQYLQGLFSRSNQPMPPLLFQYLSVIDLLESVDYMVKNSPYRKYRPHVPVQKNANLW